MSVPVICANRIPKPPPRNKQRPLSFESIPIPKKIKEFGLPQEFFSEKVKDELEELGKKDKPPAFSTLIRNFYPNGRKKIPKAPRNKDDDVQRCQCTEETKCGENCVNRLLNIECIGSNCAVGRDKCTNRRLQFRQYANQGPIRCGPKDWGLGLHAPAKRGDLIVEYCGEVLDEAAYQKRLDEHTNKHVYFMELSATEMIDASRRGNNARFINHCCEPNCETQKWTVGEETRVGIFATCDLPAGVELHYDYRFTMSSDTKPQPCFCGVETCSKFLGGKKKVLKKPKKKLRKRRGKSAGGGSRSASRSHPPQSGGTGRESLAVDTTYEDVMGRVVELGSASKIYDFLELPASNKRFLKRNVRRTVGRRLFRLQTLCES